MKKNWMGYFSVLLLCMFPCLLIYFKNAGESEITDIMPVVFLYLIVAGIVFLIFSCLYKNIAKRIVMTNVMMIFLCNYELITDLFYLFPHKYILTTVFLFLLLAGAGVLVRRLNADFIADVNKIACIVLAGLILFNGIPAIPTILHKITVDVEKERDLKALQIEKVDPETAPNVYYFIFDEYGGPQNLEQLMNYDNAEFEKFLRDQKFNVSEDSYNLETASTYVVVPNLLNLAYVVNADMDVTEQGKYMETPDLYLIMEMLGYDINTCSHPGYLYNGMSRNSFESINYFEDSAGYFALKSSAFIHLYEKYKDLSRKEEQTESPFYRETLLRAIDYCRHFPDMSLEETKPQFCMAYLQMPHLPFAFKEDGTPAKSYEEQSVWNCENYMGFLKWSNGKIEEILEYIVDKDPEAIIIIQSDHGARHIDRMREAGKEVDPAKEIYQHNILNCVYYKGETFDIGGLSGINTLQKVLNNEFGLQLEMLEYQPE